MAGRIGKPDDAHLVACLGPPFHTRDHRGGNLAGRGAGFDGARKLCPGLHAQSLQHGGVIVKRMTRQEESDRVVLASKPLGRQPGLNLRSMMVGASAAPPNISFCPMVAASWLR